MSHQPNPNSFPPPDTGSGSRIEEAGTRATGDRIGRNHQLEYSFCVQVRLLGPVTVATADATIDIPVQKHRALLIALALRSPDIVTSSELIDALWGDDPPASADKTLQGYVSALRKLLGADVIETVAGGYQLGPGVDQVDAIEFDTLVRATQQDLEHGNPQAARRSITAALALWHGHPLVDLPPGPTRDGQVARLDELRQLAVERLMEAELQLGHHREVVPDLERLVGEHPYRELLWQSLMLALYRSGRAAEALQTYQRLRTVLSEELGIEASDSTRMLEARILAHDHRLDLPEPSPPTNLRVHLDSFVDRTAERDEILALFAEHRLVTLLGLGGVGKSRLANVIGRSMLDSTPGGVWWVDVATLPTTGSVLGQVLATLQLSTSGGGDSERVLLARLRRAPTLLVLDNCEHVRSAAASFIELVTGGDQHVRILATSREPLNLAGERRVAIEPLAVTATSGQSVSDAGRLLLDRVSAIVDTDQIETAVAESITDLVGGLPLGIELAAAQCAVKTPHELSESLRDRHALLALSGRQGADSRHTTLGHVLFMSVNALEPTVARLLPRLAVCPGDFDLATAAAVLARPLLDTEHVVNRLLDASLLVQAPSDPHRRRFDILRPVREYLVGSLDEQDRRAAEAGHARHFQKLTRRLIDEADTPAETISLERVRLEDHNVRAALAWFERHDPEGALVFGPGLGMAWMNFGNQIVGRQALRHLLDSAPDAPSGLVAWTEDALTWLELLSGDVEAALTHNLDAIARFESLGDARGRSRALRNQAHAFFIAGADEATTTPIYQRSIDVAKEAGLAFSRALGEVYFSHALTSWEALDVVDVEAMLSHAESVLRHDGAHANLAHAALSRALIAFGRADPTTTRSAGEEMLRQSRLSANQIWEQVALAVLGVAAHEEGDEQQSRQHLHDAVHLAADTTNWRQLGIALHAVAATSIGRTPDVAARLWGIANTLTPIWPLFARRYGELMHDARVALGERFDELVVEGAGLRVDDAVVLADELL